MDSTKLKVNMDPSLLSVNNIDSCDPNAEEDNFDPETKSAGVWSQEMSLKLIKELEKRPLLWDPLNPLFYNPTRKLDAWREVSRIVSMPYRMCQNKVRLLTWSFRREKERMINHYSSGKVNKKYVSKFFGFESMKFLLTTVDHKRKKQIQTVPAPPVEELVVTQPVHKYKPRGKKTVTQRKEDRDSLSPEVEIKTELIEEDEPAFSSNTVETQETAQPSHSRDDEDGDDEIMAFTNFIAAKMKKYNATTRSVVQKEIGDILFRADQAQTRVFNFTL